MFIDGTFIHWPNQCEYCNKSWTTEYCSRNQSFMRKLNGMYNEYLGSLDFKCDYFTPDEDKINAKKEKEVTCSGMC